MEALAGSEASDRAQFDALLRQWGEIAEIEKVQEAAARGEWDAQLLRMQLEEEALRREGRWIRGPSNLMAVLGLQYDEVRNCRVLGWLLDPLAPHGLGTRFLDLVLTDLAKRAGRRSFAGTAAAEVCLEEQRGATRADIVVYGPGWCVLFEAKVFAGEGASQGERLVDAWAEDGATFVFLTLRGQEMKTAREDDTWIAYKWSDVTDRLAEALDSQAGGSRRTPAGRRAAEEFLDSMRRYLR